jgi:hypothetical protein
LVFGFVFDHRKNPPMTDAPEDPEYRAKSPQSSGRKVNRATINAYRRRRYATDSDYRARTLAESAKRLRKRVCKQHGISVEEFEEMLARQQGACGICERPFRRTPHIDHCHASGTVRGLLCNKCNVGLGYYDDDPTFVRKAAHYLERWLLRLSEPCENEGNGMTSNEDAAEDSGAAKLVRNAILRELRQPFGVKPTPPADWLQAVSRALVLKAEQCDVLAIKEVFDRIGGRPRSADESLTQVTMPWKSSSSRPGPPTLAKTASPASGSLSSTNSGSGAPAS